MEYDIVNREGYKFLHIPSHGFVGKSLYIKIKALMYNKISFMISVFYIMKYKPAFVIGTGSFTEIPVGLASAFTGTPLFITEQDSYPGIATRMLSIFAKKVFLSYENSVQYLKRKDNTEVAGTLSKVSKTKKTEDEIKIELGIKRRMKVILIFGGSRGARAINSVMLEILKSGLPKDIFIIWQTGKDNYEEIKRESPDFNGIIKPFIYNMPEIYSIADLVIARAGACTLAEMSDYRKAAILIPFPSAAHDHQRKNAAYYESYGAAVVMDERELDAQKLKSKIMELIYNEKRLKEMGNKSHNLHNPDSVDKVVKTILRSVRYV